MTDIMDLLDIIRLQEEIINSHTDSLSKVAEGIGGLSDIDALNMLSILILCGRMEALNDNSKTSFDGVREDILTLGEQFNRVLDVVRALEGLIEKHADKIAVASMQTYIHEKDITTIKDDLGEVSDRVNLHGLRVDEAVETMGDKFETFRQFITHLELEQQSITGRHNALKLRVEKLEGRADRILEMFVAQSKIMASQELILSQLSDDVAKIMWRLDEQDPELTNEFEGQ